ncbi:MAG: sigma 54-interacting transcriptional regulator, partial [Eubacterium sp.]
EERTVTRLGSNKIIHVNARIISSCNENPNQAIQENSFRSDLFYRLAVVYIVIPSLRIRRDDVEVLTKYFIDLYNQRFGKMIVNVDSEVGDFFKDYHWPGNVRQLRHLLESAMNIIDPSCTYIEMSHLPKYILGEDTIGSTGALSGGYHEVLESSVPDKRQDIFKDLKEKEKDLIIEALKINNGNIAKTAQQMGMSRQKLYYKLKKYHLK